MDIELGFRVTNPVSKIRKPFDAFAEGSYLRIVGTTARLLNFLLAESGAGRVATALPLRAG
jgi:hypothetical protein